MNNFCIECIYNILDEDITNRGSYLEYLYDMKFIIRADRQVIVNMNLLPILKVICNAIDNNEIDTIYGSCSDIVNMFDMYHSKRLHDVQRLDNYLSALFTFISAENKKAIQRKLIKEIEKL